MSRTRVAYLGNKIKGIRVRIKVTPEEGRGLQLGRGVWEGFGVTDKIIIALVINPFIWFTWFFMSGCYLYNKNIFKNNSNQKKLA